MSDMSTIHNTEVPFLPDPVDPSIHITTLWENWSSAARRYGERKFCGNREVLPDGSLGEYVFEDMHIIGRQLEKLSSVFTKTFGLEQGDRVSIFTPNCKEWVLAEQAANRNSIVTVPFYDSLTAKEINYILAHAAVSAVVCSAKRARTILTALTMETGIQEQIVVKNVVVIQPKTELKSDLLAELEALGEGRGIRTSFLYDIIETVDDITPPNPPQPADVASIIYTSGTTGVPKGVVLTHSNFIAAVYGYYTHGIPQLNEKAVYFSYLPLAHVLERAIFAVGVYVTGTVCFYSGSLDDILTDIGMAKPNIFVGVPRVYTRIFDGVMKKVGAESMLKQSIFKLALKYKMARMRRTGAILSVFDKIFKELRAGFGNNLQLFISGGAPLSEKVQEFMSAAFSAHFIQGYGLTECVAGCCVQDVGDTSVTNVGPAVPNMELKLAPVPEMGYEGGDAGEIMLRGPAVFGEYYHNDEETRRAFDEDGWFATGDIARFVDGKKVSIVDRKKNIFKLSQGEYVSPENLEAIYGNAALVDQMWVHGSSDESKLVAVISVDLPTVVEMLGCTTEEAAKIVDGQDPRLVARLTEDFDKYRAEEKLPSFMRIAAFHLTSEMFDPSNELLTATFKLRRNKFVEYFKDEVEAMYKSMRH
ncbi:AMP-binding enzyme [Carpediemonas membranifera]|uniref:AMP-binding enzyme n=1 Tax=Carpediemonas membranifera TaxID=201153 RepID=A0A8J6AZN7_9EUKA|nr:AMP-binding enzyme [Carpediemonas membranifera]|eukprot:KAG9389789.1 AMP-binding enzyme [Carpediemonas membranifera]